MVMTGGFISTSGCCLEATTELGRVNSEHLHLMNDNSTHCIMPSNPI